VPAAKVRIRIDAAPVTALQLGAQSGLTETLFPGRKETFSPGKGQRLPGRGRQSAVHLALSMHVCDQVCKNNVFDLSPNRAVIPKAAAENPFWLGT